MEKFSHFTYKTKVLLYALSVALLSLLFVGVGFIAYDIKDTKQNLVQSLSITSDIIGTYCATAISTGHHDEVNEVIDKLSVTPYTTGVWVFDKNQQLFASYDPYQAAWQTLPPGYQLQGAYFNDDSLVVSNPIMFGEQQLGTLLVQSNLEGITFRIIRQVSILAAMMFFSVLLAILLAIKAQKAILKPIDGLVKTAREITKKNDYSIRVPKQTEDEFGILADAINNMLYEIENRNDDLKKSEQRLNLALWGSNEVIIDWDIKNDILKYDPSVEMLLGFSHTEMPTTIKESMRIQHPDDALESSEQLKQHVIGKTPIFEMEGRLLNKKNEWMWILSRGKVVERDAKGRALRLIGTLSDITARREREESLRLFKQVFDSMAEGVMVVDPDFRLIEVNTACCMTTGYTNDEILNLSLSDFQSAKHDAAFYQNIQQAVATKGQWSGEIWQQRKTGEPYLQRTTINAMHDTKQGLVHYIVVFSDISKWKQAEDELAFISNYDTLTNLPNRNRFMMQLSDTVTKHQLNRAQLAVLTIGIDRFKMINDSFGHEIGDRLLCTVAKRLKRYFGKEAFVARLSGDEFALILTAFKNKDELKNISDNVIKTLTQPFSIDKHDILLAVSIGISLFPDDAIDTQGMIVNSDLALFYAKEKGRNSSQFYNAAINSHILESHQLENALRQAVSNKELILYYQPKIEIATGKIIGSEALMRWCHPTLGMIPPDKFIPLAEASGLINEMGTWALKTACQQNRVWQTAGFEDLKVSVNLSAHQFQQGDLPESIAEVLWETQLPAASLDLELTETVLMENADRVILMLNTLKSMGISVTVDDFGTGYSSLNYLTRFQIDGLKIDKAFIKNLNTHTEDAAIVKAIIAMAEGLQLRVVAEGVEHSDQLATLVSLGCHEIQGYYFSCPLTVEHFTALLYRSKGFLKVA